MTLAIAKVELAEADTVNARDAMRTLDTSQHPLAVALRTARMEYTKQNPKSAKVFEETAKFLTGGGSRSSIYVDPFPIYMSHGAGKYLYDVDGHTYTDFMSDMTSGLYGKTHPVLLKAIGSALTNGLQLGAHTPAEGELAQLLCQWIPSFEQVRFTTSGTDANLFAICLAQRYTGRDKILVFQGGFHGSILHNFRVTPGSKLDRSDPLTVPFAYIVSKYNDTEAARAAASAHPEEIAAIVVEPMLGAGGAVPGDQDFLRSLRTLATEIGAVLIFDEVQTARLAYGGLQTKYNIQPDLTTVGKFFGGGFAFGAFGGKQKIMQMFDPRVRGSLPHAGTWNNTAVTMVAGVTAIKELLTEENMMRVNALGDHMRESLNKLFVEEGVPFKVTGLGSINQLHCTSPSSQNAAWLRQLMYFKLLERGTWIAQRGLLSNNFEHTEEDIEQLVVTVREVARDIGSML